MYYVVVLDSCVTWMDIECCRGTLLEGIPLDSVQPIRTLWIHGYRASKEEV